MKHQTPMKMTRETERLAHRMREVRLALGLRQQDACWYYKVTRITYHKWENYGPPPKPAILYYIRLVLNRLDHVKRSRKFRAARSKKPARIPKKLHGGQLK